MESILVPALGRQTTQISKQFI